MDIIKVTIIMNKYTVVEVKTHNLIEVFEYENKRIKKLVAWKLYKSMLQSCETSRGTQNLSIT
jgi:hypothetical protein